ncbi:MAG: hypothetical protein AB7Q81_20790 [Gammaproteobacteria bacterium]
MHINPDTTHYGANLPCDERARVTRRATAAMRAYCRDPGNDGDMPAYATGRATLYAWRCEAGEAVAGRQLFHADRRGFLREFWFELAPP